MQKILEFIDRNNVTGLLDIGANVGNFSRSVKHFFPNINIFMLEANPFCDTFLKRSGIPYKIACLSDEKKEVKFYFEDKNMTGTGASYYLEDTRYYAMQNFTRMDTQLLDEVLAEECSDLIFDMIKLDTQGSEIDIMRGGPKTLAAAKYVVIELSLTQYNVGSPLKDDVLKFMEEKGFKPSEMVEEHFFDGNKIQEDWVFVR